MNFLDRARSAVARFMYGRNGVDKLCWALVGTGFVLDIAATALHGYAVRALFRVLSTTLLIFAVYRMFSRNLTRRRAENARFLSWFDPRRSALRAWLARRSDRAHKYVRCSCGAWCRVPRGVGKVELMCPRCGEKMIAKT
ncbi:MAG: hypothetical protein E7474_06700 [Ruminococcaceae bacterium]|nr:hypothetical protein [Oscillospiraceae bacterium]